MDKQRTKRITVLILKGWNLVWNKIPSVILLILFGVIPAAGLPTISGVNGTVSHNQSVTISGSDFGTKSPAAPRVYSDFEDGTNGASLSSSDWALSYEYDPPRFSNEYLRANSTMSVQSHTNTAPDQSAYQYRCAFGHADAGGLPEIYIDFWWYYVGPPNTPRCIKFIRLYPGSGPSYSGDPNTYIDFDCGPFSGHLDTDGLSVQDGNESTWIDDDWDWTDAASWAGGDWVHIQGYFKESDIGVENGSVIVWADCRKFLSEDGNFISRKSGVSDNWKSIFLGNYLSTGTTSPCSNNNGGPGSCTVPTVKVAAYYDNVYIDTTRARVEMGDKSDYSSCTHREIQIPSLWSPNSITIRVDQGTFNSGTAYLFVIDLHGNVSEGYSITIGSIGEPTQLLAPSNLIIK